MRNTLYDVVILALIVVCIGGYYVYRDTQSTQWLKSQSFTRLASIPATKCSVSEGTFNGSAAGTMHIWNGKVVVNIVALRDTQEGRLHYQYIIDPRKPIQVYVYPETKQLFEEGFDLNQIAPSLDAIIFEKSWQCEPWWIPSSSVFVTPTE